MANAVEQLKVFVSYSRDDLEFAEQLVLALNERGFEPVIDRESIDAGEEWEKRLGELIFGCDTVLFVLSTRSAESRICRWEVEQAESLHKRMIPVVPAPVVGVTPPPQLADLNYIFFYPESTVPGSGFYDGVIKLDRALRVDLDWLREATRLSEAAAVWNTNNRDEAWLRRGAALADAQDWHARMPTDAEVQSDTLDFLTASANAETRRRTEAEAQVADRQRALDEREAAVVAERAAVAASRRFLAILKFTTAFAVLAALVAGWQYQLAVQQRDEAERSSRESTARKLAAQAEGLSHQWFDRRLLLALEAGHVTEEDERSIPAVETILRSIVASSPLGRALGAFEETHKLVTFSPDGQILAVGSGDGTVRLWDVKQQGAAPTVLSGHEGMVLALAFSPDGRRLATGSWDGAVRVWDLDKPEHAPKVLQGHESAVNYVVFDPLGRWLATANGFQRIGLGWSTKSAKTAIRLWDVNDLDAELLLFRGQKSGDDESVSTLVFDPSGDFLVSGSTQGLVRVWDTSNIHADPTVLAAHAGMVLATAFSPDGDRLATADDISLSKKTAYAATGTSTGAAIKIWSMHNLEAEPKTLHSQKRGVTDLAFGPAGRTLASANVDGTVRVWRGDGFASMTTLEGHEAKVVRVAFSRSGETLASGSMDRTVRLWDVTDRQAQPVVLRGHERSATNLPRFSPDGRILATGSVVTGTPQFSIDSERVNSKAYLWDVQKAMEPALASLVTDGVGVVRRLSGVREGRLLSWDKEGAIRLFEKSQPLAEPLVVRRQNGRISMAALSVDGSTLAIAGSDGSIRLWNLTTPGVKPLTLSGKKGYRDGLMFSADGTSLLWSDSKGTVRGWKISDPEASPTRVNFAEEGKLAELFGTNGEALAIASAGVLDAISNFKHGLWAVSADGDRLAHATNAGEIALVKVGKTGLEREVIGQHVGEVSALAFSEDGRVLVSGNKEGTIRLWSVSEPAKRSMTFVGAEGRVTKVLLKTESGRLIAVYATRTEGPEPKTIYTVRMWNRQESVQEAIILGTHAQYPIGLALSDDERSLIYWEASGAVMQWPLEYREVAEQACAIAGRNLSRGEWDRYFKREPYRRTCQQWPLHESFDDILN